MRNPKAERFLQNLQSTQVQSPPQPWHLVSRYAVGGLTDIGYAENSDLLLVVSSSGRGIFDCLSGEKIARDYEDGEWFNTNKLLALGFGPLEGQVIRTAGMYGGGLRNSTDDGWQLENIYADWPTSTVVLVEPFRIMIDDVNPWHKLSEEVICTFRACGFSETGLSFVIASSCGLDIFARQV